jgi:RimJ/RimL family protein N-acetyltransferase
MLRDDPAFIPELKRKGYATEAVKLALRWASECIVI